MHFSFETCIYILDMYTCTQQKIHIYIHPFFSGYVIIVILFFILVHSCSFVFGQIKYNIKYCQLLLPPTVLSIANYQLLDSKMICPNKLKMLNVNTDRYNPTMYILFI